MSATDQQQVLQMLQSDWDLHIAGTISEEEILLQLEKRILHIADKNPEVFFQLMYRLDVPEEKVRNVLFETDAAMQIAKMVYKRQLQKIEARKWFKNDEREVDNDLKW
jgi:hypothetical protein